MVEHPDKTEQKQEKGMESSGESKTVTLDQVKASKGEGKALFAHMMPGEKNKEIPPSEKWSVERNHLAIPDDTATRVAAAVKQYEAKGKGYDVYNDLTWTARHGGPTMIGQYLYFEEGNSLTGAVKNLPPLRTGTELDLYDKITRYAKTHDITDPSQKITQDQVMTWALDVNNVNGRVCVQDAILTAHNVMRALARPEVVVQENLPKGDPIKQIIEDMTLEKKDIHGRPSGLVDSVKEKYHLRGAKSFAGQELFDQSNPYSTFKANTDDRNSSTGSAYHFWVGLLASSSLSPTAAKAMVWGEGTMVKNNDKTGQDEKPWGWAGVAAWERMP